MNPAEIRLAIAAQLENQVDGLRVYARIPSAVVPPAATVELGPIDYHQDFDGGTLVAWSVLCIVSRFDDERAQDALDEFAATDTGNSIVAATDSDSTFAGTVDWNQVTTMDAPGVYTFGDVDYLGVRFNIETMVS